MKGFPRSLAMFNIKRKYPKHIYERVEEALEERGAMTSEEVVTSLMMYNKLKGEGNES